jgi:hypothetical protein
MNKIKYFFTLIILCFLNSIFGMDSTSKTTSSTTPLSPTKIETSVTNYCKEIIKAFNADDLNEVKRLWYDFFNNIRYTIKISSRKPEEAKKLQLATFFCIAHCLASNAQGPIKVYINQKNNLIYLALRNKNNIYILQFHAIDDPALSNTPIHKYLTAKGDFYKVIGIDIHPFGISCNKILNDYEFYTSVEPAILKYNETNFFKKMFWRGFVEHDMNQLCKILSTIYNNIPQAWRVDSEKFYQSILAWILIFMGNAKTMPEETTAKGRIDITVTTPQFTNIVEFKLNGKATKALQQIIDKEYAQTVHDSNKTTILIGINVDTRQENEVCVTSAFEKHAPKTPSPVKTPRQHKGKKRKEPEPSQAVADDAFDVFSLPKEDKKSLLLDIF